MRYTRQELQRIVAARHGQPEATGGGAFIEFKVKATPELLEGLIGGYWTSPDGRVSRLDAIDVQPDGYVVPLFKIVAQAEH